MTTWAQVVRDGPDIDPTRVEVCSNDWRELRVRGSASDAGTVSSPLVLRFTLDEARSLFGSLGRVIEEIEANADPS